MGKRYVDNPKPPRQFYLVGDDGNMKPQEVWACGECLKLTIGNHAKESASNCCKKRYCAACGSAIEKMWYRDKCSDCLAIKSTEQMTIVEYDGGPLCQIDGDRYFSDMEELLDYYHDDDTDELPEFAHPCDEHKWQGLPESCIDVAIENECNELFEDAYDHIGDLSPLYKAIREWNKKQHLNYWTARTKEKVRIPWPHGSGS